MPAVKTKTKEPTIKKIYILKVMSEKHRCHIFFLFSFLIFFGILFCFVNCALFRSLPTRSRSWRTTPWTPPSSTTALEVIKVTVSHFNHFLSDYLSPLPYYLFLSLVLFLLYITQQIVLGLF